MRVRIRNEVLALLELCHGSDGKKLFTRLSIMPYQYSGTIIENLNSQAKKLCKYLCDPLNHSLLTGWGSIAD